MPPPDASMTNCYKIRQRFFEKNGSIDSSSLIAHWMISGHLDLDKADSVEIAYETGVNLLAKLMCSGVLYGAMNEISASTDPKNNHCNHVGECTTIMDDLINFSDLGRFMLRDQGVFTDDQGSALLLDDNGFSELDLSSSKRLLYIFCINTSGNTAKALLQSLENPPYVLSIHGSNESWCDDSIFEKLRGLTALELSGRGVYAAPERLYDELPQLQRLKLTYFTNVDMTGTSIYALPLLRYFIVTHSTVRRVPNVRDKSNLEVFRLSHCHLMEAIIEVDTSTCPQLRVLDLSHNKTDKRVSGGRSVLCEPFWNTTHLSSVRELFIHASNESDRIDLSIQTAIEVLDLSNLQISSLDTLSDEVPLRKLILRGCKRLRKLPRLQKFESLVVLDISDCKKIRCLPSLANPSHLQRLYARGLELDSIEMLGSLTGLAELDLCSVKIRCSPEELNADFLESLEKLEDLNLSQTCVAVLPPMTNHMSLRRLTLADCPRLKILPHLSILNNLDELELPLRGHSRIFKKLVYTNSSDAINDSENNVEPFPGSCIFSNLADKLLDLVSHFEKARESAADAPNTRNTTHGSDKNAMSSSIDTIVEVPSSSNSNNSNTGHKDERKLVMLKKDVEYIKKNEDRIGNSPNCKRACDILQNLLDVDDDWSDEEFSLNSDKIQQLVYTVAKVKLLFPQTQASEPEASETIKKKEFQFFSSKDNKNNACDIVKEFVSPEILRVQMDKFQSSYMSLTTTERHCLLCFSVFPFHIDEDKENGVLTVKNIEIKKKDMIYWWFGQGLINPCPDETGEEIFKVLINKGFVQSVVGRGSHTRRCSMNPFAHSFVTDMAKRDEYFNFSNDNGKLTPFFKSSERALILRSQHRIPSSCRVWAEYAKSPEKLERFRTVKTLFNVNESVINIQSEWFSKMRDLCVLHLGNWHSGPDEHIEVGDQKFLEDLKSMKQLKLVSLQGVSTISKLPDSICKLTSLVILNLRECHNLEELPAEIGSLRNLTHLDIWNCHLLTKLPKGVSLLLKLEVFKGFVVYDQPGGLEDEKKNSIFSSCLRKAEEHLICGLLSCEKKKVCTLKDLLKLECLRELSIVVHDEQFPDNKEIKVFKQMWNLRKLKISWGMSFKDVKKSGWSGQVDDGFQGGNNLSVEIQQEDKSAKKEVSTRGIQDAKKGHDEDMEKKSGGEFLDQIEKLELWCLPCKTAPNWLVPQELKNLKKLCIRGGKLERLAEGANSNKWNVTTLRLRNLSDLKITWQDLRATFPALTFLDKHKCKKLHFFPCDCDGVWKVEYKLP